MIPAFKSRASKISRNKMYRIFDIVVQSMKVTSLNVWELIWISKVPLFVIDWRSVSIMSTRSRTRRVIHLTFDCARVATRLNNVDTEYCSESRMGFVTLRGATELFRKDD